MTQRLKREIAVILILAMSILPVIVWCSVSRAAGNESTGAQYSCAVAQTVGTDTDFRVSLGYNSGSQWMEQYWGNPTTTDAMQVAGGEGTYELSYKTSLTTDGIYILTLSTNLYKGTKVTIRGESLKITTIGGKTAFYDISNALWACEDFDESKPYCLTMKNPYCGYNSGSVSEQNPAVNVFNENIPVTAGSTLTISFSVHYGDSSNSSINESDLKLSGVSAKYTTVSGKSAYQAAAKISWKANSNANGYIVYRSSKKGSGYKAIATITKQSTTSYQDTKVTKGNTYYYKVCAYGELAGKKVYGAQSTAKAVKISSALLTPSVTSTRKGNNLTVTFKKAEGSNYESQYRYLGDKKWKKLSALSGKMCKKVTKKIKAKGFQVRIRTYMKVKGKKVYSKYSNTLTVR